MLYIRAYPCPGQQLTTRNGRADLTRQFIRYGLMATVPHGHRAHLSARTASCRIRETM